MNQNTNIPEVVMDEKQEAMLHEGIGLILSRWTAMRAAVENGWGGPHSQAKAERTVTEVFDHFTVGKDPMNSDALEDILLKGLDELNTVADDGSLEEVPELLLDLYEEFCNGNFETLEKLRATKSQTSSSVVKVSNGNDEDDEESDDEDNDETTDMMVDASEQSSNRKSEAMPVDKPAADDGWTVVPSRRNKGKRN